MREQGSATIKTLIALIVVAALIVGVVKIVPVYVSVYEFEDAMRQQAKFAGVERKNEAVIRDELFKKAQDLKLPITREQIEISRRMGGVNIKVSYSVPIDLIVVQRDFNFDYEADTSTAY
ncbi:MAG: DUF4845 domain-containing protein [Candidatus Acidiferrales bacterium]